MIIKTETRKGIKTFIVDKSIPESKINTILNSFVKPSHIKNIITESCDVYTKEGKLLLKFRKDILNDTHVDDFYYLPQIHKSILNLFYVY